jgi:hypothetical protein
MKKQIPILFLQAVTVLVGVAALLFMLWEPHLEGRNADATFFEVYFNDLFLAYIYLASLPFFVALYQVCRILQYIGQNKLLSQETVAAFKKIKYCAFTVAGAIFAADAYLVLAARTNGEDAAGAIMLGLIITCASITAGVAAGVLEGALRDALQSEK